MQHFVDEDSLAIRRRYHDNVPREKSEQIEWREMRYSWKQLPGIYLKLSKSRLTGMFVCVCVFP